jgi:hypothetical protein
VAGFQVSINGRFWVSTKDGVEHPAHTPIPVPSGVHVVAARLAFATASPRIVRVPPLAKVHVVVRLVADGDKGEVTPDSVVASVVLVRQYLDAVQLQLITRSVGYGTTRLVDDKNSYDVWRLMKRDVGDAAVPALIDTLRSSDAHLRMKALQLLLHFAVDSAESVDHEAIQRLMRREPVSVILQSWIAHLQRVSESRWPLLVDLLTSDELGPQTAGIPATLQRLLVRGDSRALQIEGAVTKALTAIPNAASRGEVIRALGGKRAGAVAAIADALKHDPDPTVRSAAAYVLADGPAARVFDDLLNSLRTDGTHQVRVAAARALLKADVGLARQEFDRVLAGEDSATKAAVDEASRYSV